MALYIEDGSIVENANSFVTLAEARSYAADRGVALPADDLELEPLAFQAMDYLESKRDRYSGSKVSSAQELQFPRYNVYVDGNLIESNAIPKELKKAQMQLMIELFNGVELMPTRTEPMVIEDKTGPLTTKFSEKVGVSLIPEMSSVEALLKPLYKNVGFGLIATRV